MPIEGSVNGESRSNGNGNSPSCACKYRIVGLYFFAVSLSRDSLFRGTAMKGITGVLPAVLLVFLGFSQRLAADNMVFRGLGFIDPGHPQSEASAVSADGQVVCGTALASSPYPYVEPFRWTDGNGMMGLGVLPGAPPQPSTLGMGMSSAGDVIVGRGQGPNGPEAFRWSVNGGMTGLGDLPGGWFDSIAYDVSADGAVVTGYSRSADGVQAFRWTADYGMVGIGDLPGGDSESRAYGISDDGSTIVGSSHSDAGNEAFIWTADNGMRGLGFFDGGLPLTLAYDVSADGSVVVGYGRSEAGFEAFRWTEDEGIVGLGDLEGWPFFSAALGVSTDGSVIVGYGGLNGYDAAFLWTEQMGMVALHDLLVNNGVNLNGWRLEEATAVSADGQTIVGSGRNPAGQHEAWLAVIPEPSSAILILLAMVLLNRRS